MSDVTSAVDAQPNAGANICHNKNGTASIAEGSRATVMHDAQPGTGANIGQQTGDATPLAGEPPKLFPQPIHRPTEDADVILDLSAESFIHSVDSANGSQRRRIGANISQQGNDMPTTVADNLHQPFPTTIAYLF